MHIRQIMDGQVWMAAPDKGMSSMSLPNKDLQRLSNSRSRFALFCSPHLLGCVVYRTDRTSMEWFLGHVLHLSNL